MPESLTTSISIKYIIGAIVAFLTAAWAGWKLFFSSRIKQLDEVAEGQKKMGRKLDLHAQKLDDHLDHEKKWQERTTFKIDQIQTKIEEIWKSR